MYCVNMHHAGNVTHGVVHVASFRTQNDDGSSRGCGVVDFQNAADALRAISQLSNSMLDGSQIHVREYREEPRGGPGSAGPPSGPGSFDARGPPPRGGSGSEVQIVVHGLPYPMVWQGLKDLVRDRSRIEAVRATITTGSDGRSKGWGLVLLRNMDDAQAVIRVWWWLCMHVCCIARSTHVHLPASHTLITHTGGQWHDT